MESSKKSINYCIYYLLNGLCDNGFDENFEDNLLNELNKELIKQNKNQFVLNDYYLLYGKLVRDNLENEEKLERISISFSARSEIFIQIEKEVIKKSEKQVLKCESPFTRPFRINDNMFGFMTEFLDEIGLHLKYLTNKITTNSILTKLFVIYGRHSNLNVDKINLHSSYLMDKYFEQYYKIKNIDKNKFKYSEFQYIISSCKLDYVTQEEMKEKNYIEELEKENKFLTYFLNVLRKANKNK